MRWELLGEAVRELAARQKEQRVYRYANWWAQLLYENNDTAINNYHNNININLKVLELELETLAKLCKSCRANRLQSSPGIETGCKPTAALHLLVQQLRLFSSSNNRKQIYTKY
jgi:hypothetical protein